MKQIIKFIDVNIDGCGTNVEFMVQVEGKQELTINTPNGVIRDADTILEDYLDNRETEISGIAEEVFGIYKNTTDKESVEIRILSLHLKW